MTPPGEAWPLVTVVTPSYNQAAFLEATIRSVLEQDYPRLEYVVMDGGSSDGSVEIIARYADRLAGWVSEPDGGQAAAVNAGWRRARGEILAYLNSDDLYFPSTVRRAVEHLERNPETGIVYGAEQLIDEQGRPLGRPLERLECSLSWLLRYPLPQPTMFFRRRVFDRIGWLDASLRYTFDWEFTLRASVAGVGIARVPGPPLAAFRCWDGQKTASRFEEHIEEQLRIRDRLGSAPAFPAALAGELALSRAWAYLWPAYQHYARGDTRAARELLHRARRLEGAIARQPAFLSLYVRTLLGRRLSRAARSLKARLSGAALASVPQMWTRRR